ncbi:cell division protein ZapA [Aestuariibacter sp. AA17]|uniref:Cell division protein ZapA n=1 Tax=Fluctibacter corallii TaxID=2984329 RepID=A0ABT3A4D1_9ALTE|nr:cell division protein ZapA [Aestuariibacter sp. AA17]MCV2883457.1 cell division protein ZapA [Aestuariibacter sp. AA17]
MASTLVSITLLGKRYKVRCPEGKEQELNAVAQRLSERLEETKRSSGLTAREDIIMMTALNMCHAEHQSKD